MRILPARGFLENRMIDLRDIVPGFKLKQKATLFDPVRLPGWPFSFNHDFAILSTS